MKTASSVLFPVHVRKLPARHDRGSVLIVALILAALIGIALVSYLQLSNSSLNLSQRNFYDNSAMNLAEAGLERALYCVNRNQVSGDSLTAAWPTGDGWTTNTSTHKATATFSGFAVGPNTTGSVKVYVANYDLVGPVTMVAQSTVSQPNGIRPLSKFIEVTLANRNMFAGLVAKNSITADSNLRVDSWISTNPSTFAFTPYGSAVARANGPIGVVSASNGALNLGDNPTIYGTVNTGGGSVSKSGSAKLSNVVGGTGWSPALVNTGFTYVFPTITVPVPSVVNNVAASITGSITLPSGTDLVASDGKYYYQFAAGAVVNYGASTMTITKPVVFLMTNHSGTTVISTSDHATFTYGIASGDTGSFNLYTDGNISFDSGANWFTNKAPVNTAIWGINPTSQTFVTRGGGNFYGSIIAENATITFDSGTNIYGAFSVKAMSLLGGVNFHYDESLGLVGGGGYKVTQWKELQSATERAVYSSALNF